MGNLHKKPGHYKTRLVAPNMGGLRLYVLKTWYKIISLNLLSTELLGKDRLEGET